MVVLKLIDEGYNPPPTYQDIICHMIFDIKMKDFRKKALFVAGGHATVAPPTSMYASVVSQYILRIALTLAAFNDMEVKTSDI